MAKPLIEGFNAYQNALCEGFGLDAIKRAGRNVIDFTKGFIHGVLPGAACLVLPWIPIEAVNYGKKLYDQHKIDKEYAIKLNELNQAINYMNTVEIKVPKELARRATSGRTIIDVLEGQSRLDDIMLGDCILNHIGGDYDGPHYKACEAAHRVTNARITLAEDTKQALRHITNCLSQADTDKSYECKENTLNDIDEAIDKINEDNRHLYQVLVSYSNEVADRAKVNASRFDDITDAAAEKVNAKMTDYRSDIPEWETDSKAVCDTIHKGPGYWDRYHDCIDNLWK